MRILLLTALIMISAQCFAQREMSVDYADSITQLLYDNQQWKELSRVGERAVDAGVESYLVRVRTGVAYYELEEYARAIPHLRKAVNTGYSDGTVKEKLYYSYKLTGREEDANDVFFDMTDSRQRKLRPLINDFIYDAYGGFAYSFTSDESNNGSIDLDGSDNVFGEQTISNYKSGFNIGLSQLPIRWLKVSYAFTYVNSERKKEFMYNNLRFTESYRQKQGRLFNEFNFRVMEGLVIAPAGHYVNSKETLPAVTQVNNGYVFADSVIEQDDFVLSLTASKWFSVFKASLTGSFSYLNGEHQSQFGASLKVFPLRESYLYLISDAVVHDQNSVSNFVFKQSAGGRLAENLWLEAFATFGKMRNFNEQNGFIVYNDPDVINLKYGAEMKYFFPFNLTASLIYEGRSQEKNYTTFELSGYSNNSPVYSPQSKSADYSMSTIALFLKYDF